MMRLVMAIAMAMLTSCTYVVTGDSTANQVADAALQTIDLTEPGCGFTAAARCAVPLGDVEDGQRVIAFVSVNDRTATNVDGYRTATTHYTAQGADVIWVAVPEKAAPFYGITAAQLAALNDRVEAALGCTLASSTHRDAPMVDGVHYTPEGATQVAVKLEAVTGPTCTVGATQSACSGLHGWTTTRPVS